MHAIPGEGHATLGDSMQRCIRAAVDELLQTLCCFCDLADIVHGHSPPIKVDCITGHDLHVISWQLAPITTSLQMAIDRTHTYNHPVQRTTCDLEQLPLLSQR